MPEPTIAAAALDAAARTLREQTGSPGQLAWDDLHDELRSKWRERALQVLTAAWPWLAGRARREVAIEFSYPHWDGHVETVPHGGPLGRGGDPDEWAAEAIDSHEQRGAVHAQKLVRTVWTGDWLPVDEGSLSRTPESSTVSREFPNHPTGRQPE